MAAGAGVPVPRELHERVAQITGLASTGSGEAVILGALTITRVIKAVDALRPSAIGVGQVDPGGV
jgi:hypothetical protein